MSIKSSLMKIPFYNHMVLPWHYLQALRYGVKYSWPAKRLRVIGVTGTNGKTTTSFMVWKMLNESGHKAGLLTTVAWGGVDGDESKIADDGLDAHFLHKQLQHMTTESVGILGERMRAIADAGAEFLVIEITSHALAQFRTLGVPVEVAVFTNLTHDHLDYHKTFENYRKVKGKLFKGACKAVINADDKNGEWFAKQVKIGRVRSGQVKDMQLENASGDISNSAYDSCGDIIKYGVETGNLRATDIKLNADGVEYTCDDIREKCCYSSDDIDGGSKRQGGVEKLRIRTKIPGEFNVYNSLAAVGVGMLVGLSDEEIEHGLYALSAVEGRMTRVDEGQNFAVIVDYAHAPDALEKVFESVKCDGRIIAVHGGAGQRDHSTRAIRGEILAKNSDIVIITEDDTRDEDLSEIMQMFVKGAEKAGKRLDKDLFMIPDRAEAIERAVREARKGDLVLILGKGHEKTILRPDGEYPFEDIKVAKKALKGLRK